LGPLEFPPVWLANIAEVLRTSGVCLAEEEEELRPPTSQ